MRRKKKSPLIDWKKYPAVDHIRVNIILMSFVLKIELVQLQRGISSGKKIVWIRNSRNF